MSRPASAWSAATSSASEDALGVLPVFGPLVAFGPGGVLAKLNRQAAFALPWTRRVARAEPRRTPKTW